MLHNPAPLKPRPPHLEWSNTDHKQSRIPRFSPTKTHGTILFWNILPIGSIFINVIYPPRGLLDFFCLSASLRVRDRRRLCPGLPPGFEQRRYPSSGGENMHPDFQSPFFSSRYLMALVAAVEVRRKGCPYPVLEGRNLVFCPSRSTSLSSGVPLALGESFSFLPGRSETSGWSAALKDWVWTITRQQRCSIHQNAFDGPAVLTHISQQHCLKKRKKLSSVI